MISSLAKPTTLLKLLMDQNGMVLRRVKCSVSVGIPGAWGGTQRRLSSFPAIKLGNLCSPMLALGSGIEGSITDQMKNELPLGNVKTAVESHDEEKIYVRVNLTGEQTQRAFDHVLTNLAKTAPPIPGFRRTKGGKTSIVPKSFLLQIIGKDHVTNFVIQEKVCGSINNYVKKESVKVKTQFKTAQTAEELKVAFLPGSDFGFNAAIEIEKLDSETTCS